MQLVVSFNSSCQDFERSRKAMLRYQLQPALRFKWVRGEEPIAPWINVQVQHLREPVSFKKKLPLWNQALDSADFNGVQSERLRIELGIEIWTRKKNLRRAALDKRPQY